MKFGRKMKMAAASVAAVVAIAAAPGPLNTIVETAGGHRMGDPEAKTKLIEFVSYTCSHCASFERQSEGALKLAFIQPGKGTVEIRHIIRDPIDLTAVLLTHCGGPEKFFSNHTAFMLAQKSWMAKANAASQAQQQRWFTGDYAARRRAIASDLDFYAIMQRRGYERTTVDRCLNDDAYAQAQVSASFENGTKYGVSGTPSFALNGTTLEGVHSWVSLSKVLQKATSETE